MRKLLAGAAATAMLAAAPGTALAGGVDAYKGTGGNVQTGVAGKGPKGTGTLPFTGLDVAAVAGGGLALLLAGGAVRRHAERA